jgi:hypothetical protein
VLLLIAMITFGHEPLGLARDLVMVAGWGLNAGIAEILIRRPFGRWRGQATMSGPP